MFDFDVSHINWPVFLENYWIGVKCYALNEDVSQLAVARQAANRCVYAFNFHLLFFPVLYHKAASVHADWGEEAVCVRLNERLSV